MAAFVERTRLEEEHIRRKREEVELQLLRMRRQEAVRQQQQIKMRMATQRADAAMLRSPTASPLASPTSSMDGGLGSGPSTPSPASPPASDFSSGAALGSNGTGPEGSIGGGSSGPSGVPGGPRKKLILKKSKRMSAVAAAAGLHRVGTAPGSLSLSSTSSPPLAAPSTSSSASSYSAFAGDRGVALLSREDLIEANKNRLGAGAAGVGPWAEGEEGGASALAAAGTGLSDGEGCSIDEPEKVVVPKPIFIISDCTGESAARTVRAALNQFEVRCRTQAPAQIIIFRFVESKDKSIEIIKEAAKEDALVVYTLVDPKTVKAVQTACKALQVPYVDLWTELLDTMEVHLNAVRSGVPASAETLRKPKAALSDEYFKMIEAVEYTRKADDGAHPQDWKHADLLILGVSRCGKTPLSIYLGQRGYKVANLPLIPGCPVPKELYEIDQSRIVGLIIDPGVLASIRRNRITMMGVSRAQSIDYAEIQKINTELDWARKLYNTNPSWPVLDVTLRGIEETAAKILKMLNDRRGDASPMWVEAYHAKQLREQALAQAAAQQPISATLGAASSSPGSSPLSSRDGGSPLASRDGGDGPGPARGGEAQRSRDGGVTAPYPVLPELIYGGAHEGSFMLEGLY
ncbi:hypothetical protein HYH03_010320 [Edaphochlamys debaryana]|uniref:Uncharacterized protein n=1 Tax=Edaphochlamys debaryana TaxID=47281 RepID=A0A835Y5A6_9CHLO|nr:hypothetical protein HYH03_010320 [Edaphochlamys debaryana]|eukprot:KAG2491314.1 hypothetical protein HYH03_010320 [Edaphochlamys debaryana]